ncbi:hypothetical protein [Micromonospora mirobrigensis]|uniref:hypothetical protein n=1 Tax=Micromonospora mirobrigensis TaxID=262898 RepID=UPI00114CFD39|nr:hypothetical protein [Micromonospora mirobrigensis]
MEHIFVHSAASPRKVATQIALALDMEILSGDDGGTYLSRPAQTDGDAKVGGEVAENHLADLTATGEDMSLLNGYEVLWDFGFTGRKRGVQIEEARTAFGELASAAIWPVALVAGLDILVAAWDPALGLTWFPPGTTPDMPDWLAWQRYAERLAGAGATEERN